MKINTKTLTVSLLNYNTLGTPFIAPLIKDRYRKIAEGINKSDLDIVCFQEVATYYHLSLLKQFLPNYKHVAYHKTLMGPRGALATFSKIPFDEVQYDGFSQLGTWKMYTQLVRNGILAVKLQGVPLYILNTHLITDFEYKTSSNNPFYRFVKVQAEEVAMIANRFAKEKNTVIVTGDFNMSKDDPMYKQFLKTTKAEDLFNKHHFPTYYNDRLMKHFNAARSVRIDYIFLLNRYGTITVKSIEHAFTDKVKINENTHDYLSDHIGLRTKFIFRQ